MGTLGETLRQARLDKGVSLAEAEQETRIRRRYLEALENEDFSALPAPVYARGMIRNYARYLGLSAEKLVDLYQAARPREERILIGPAATQLSRGRSVSLRSLLATLAGLAAVGMLGYAWSQYSTLAETIERVQQREVERTLEPGATGVAVAVRTPTRLAVAPLPTATPSPSPSPSPVPTPIEGVVIEARLVAPTWVEVWVDGTKVVSETLQAGSSRRFEARQSVRMRVGNGAAVEVTENGIARGALDAGGRAVEARWSRG